MSTEDKSGPAFPGWTQNHYTDQRPTGGMTLRDYFAAKAMQGFAADPEAAWKDGTAGMAKCAYDWADAMMAARGA